MTTTNGVTPPFDGHSSSNTTNSNNTMDLMDSAGVVGNMGNVLSENEVRALRKRRGECMTCGRKTHTVKRSVNRDRRIPLNIDGFCENGRCLICHPKVNKLRKRRKRRGKERSTSPPPVEAHTQSQPRTPTRKNNTTRNNRFSPTTTLNAAFRRAKTRATKLSPNRTRPDASSCQTASSPNVRESPNTNRRGRFSVSSTRQREREQLEECVAPPTAPTLVNSANQQYHQNSLLSERFGSDDDDGLDLIRQAVEQRVSGCEETRERGLSQNESVRHSANIWVDNYSPTPSCEEGDDSQRDEEEEEEGSEQSSFLPRGLSSRSESHFSSSPTTTSFPNSSPARSVQSTPEPTTPPLSDLLRSSVNPPLASCSKPGSMDADILPLLKDDMTLCGDDVIKIVDALKLASTIVSSSREQREDGPTLSLRVQIRCVRKLQKWASLSSSSSSLIKKAMIATVWTMDRNIHSSDLQVQSFLALIAFLTSISSQDCDKPEEEQEEEMKQVSLNALNAIQLGMRTYSAKERLQEIACRALRMVLISIIDASGNSRDYENDDDVNNIHVDVIAAMRNHCYCLLVQVEGLNTLLVFMEKLTSKTTASSVAEVEMEDVERRRKRFIAKIMREAGTIEVALTALESHPGVFELERLGCTVLRHVVTNDFGGICLLEDFNGFELLANVVSQQLHATGDDTIDEHSSLTIIEMIIHILVTCTAEVFEMREPIYEASNCIESILGVMSKYMTTTTPSNRIIQHCCTILRHLCSDPQRRVDILRRRGRSLGRKRSLELVRLAMNTHSEDASLQREGVGVLSYMLQDLNDPYVNAVSTSTILKTLICAMKLVPDSEELQLTCIKLLCKFARLDASNKRLIQTSHGIEPIIVALRTHNTSKSLVETSFKTIWSLGLDEENQQVIARFGGVDAIIEGLRDFVMEKKVVEAGIGALRSLSGDSLCNQKIVKGNGLDVIVLAIQIYISSPQEGDDGNNNQDDIASTYAISLLSNVAASVGDRHDGGQIIGTSVIQAVLDIMKAFPHSASIQKTGCDALYNFSLSRNILLGMMRGEVRDEILNLVFIAKDNFPDECSRHGNQVAKVLMSES